MDGKSINLLLIEDNPGDVRLIQEVLKEARHVAVRLETADRLSAGLERLSRGDIDIVLLDLGLVDSQGLDTLRRTLAVATTVPIIVLTGIDDDTVGIDAIQAGAQDYLVKGQVDSRLVVRAARYAIERKQAEEALKRYTERLSILHEIDLAILSAQTSKDIAQRALQMLDRLVPCHHSSIALFDFETGEFTRLAVKAEGRDALATGRKFPLEYFVADWDKLRQKLVSVRNDIQEAAETSPVQEALKAEGVYSHVNVPLIFQSDLIGSLNLAAATPGFFTAEHLEIAQEVASQVAIAIQQARLNETERQQRTLAESLQDTAKIINSSLDLDEVFKAILGNVSRVVSHDAAEIWLIEDDVARVVGCAGYAERSSEEALLALRLSVTGTQNLYEAIQSGKPVVIRDTQEYSSWVTSETTDWARSVITVPIKVKDRTLGFLNLVSAAPDFYSPSHGEHLQAFANQAAIAIQNARLYEELEAYNSILEQAVEERTAELLAANEQLKELDQMKDVFLSTAAHELRTPLTSIRAFSELLLIREFDGERERRYLTMIKDQSQRLADIINDLLDVAKLEATGGLKFQFAPLILGELIEETLEPFNDTAPNHLFEVQGVDEMPLVRADRFRLGQVLTNLLSNAVKYSPDGGTVTIRSRVVGKDVEISVQDEGIGMTSEEMAHLFEKFYRAPNTSGITGTGLGLAICRLIVEKHRGNIRAESKPGEGTLFSFTVPLIE